MFLQRLIELRERIDDIVPPPHHQVREIDWILELDAEGVFLGWARAGGSDQSLEAPVAYRKRSGRKPPPYLLVDNYPYLLGDTIDPDDITAEKSAQRHEMFVELIDELAEAVADTESEATVDAVRSFLATDEKRRAFENIPESLTRGDLIAFRIDGVQVQNARPIRRFWADMMDAEEARKSKVELECILCGEMKPIPPKHPIDIRVGPDPAPIVSANKNAFESYGLRRAAIAPICATCAREYGEAARYLLSEDSTHLSIGDVTYAFWTRSLKGAGIVGLLMSPDPASVKTLLKSVFSGIKRTDGNDAEFYMVAMTSNKRMVVRDYLETTLPAVKRSIARWFRHQSIADAEPMSLTQLAGSTVREFKDLPPQTVPALLDAALREAPLPTSLLANALRRARADTDNRLTRPRVALIKMVLNDNFKGDGPMVSDALSPEDHRPAYLCGRLLALLEQIQRRAIPNLNATLTDRFFGTASTAPASVFGRLMRGSQSHLQKIRKSNRGAYEGLQSDMEEIMSDLTEFPRTLSLEEQGLFAMGYYHQRADMRRARRERFEAAAEEE